MKDLSRLIASIAAIIALALFATACNSETTITEYGTDGKIVKVTTETKESPLAHKDMSFGGACSAVKLETTGSTSSGTPTANFTLGGGAGGLSSSPNNSTRPVMGCSWSSGWLASITNAKATTGEIRYIGAPGESAAETAKRLAALLKVKDGAISADSASANDK